jgi:type IV secretion system protein VirD4
LEAPGREKCAYFCILPDTDSTFEFLSSLFFTFLFIKLTKLGDKSGGQCPVNINFLLDEFCNIGAVPDFKKRIATMRSRGISCEIITQSLPQIRNRYPQDEWQEIISCCDTRLFLGINDNDTAKYLSETLGEGTIDLLNIRRHTKDLLHVQVGKTPTRRALLKLDETLRLDEKDAVLIIRGRHPLIVEKLSYEKHPLAGELIPKKTFEYTPSWRDEPLPEIEIDWGSMTGTGELPIEAPLDIEETKGALPASSSSLEITEEDLLSRFGDPETVPKKTETDEVKYPVKGWF